MVKADSYGCNGCYQCCTGMGRSVILDPYDVHRLTNGLQMSFQELLNCGILELGVVDGCILPNLKMQGQEERCALLSREGRCSVHPYRPGVCRLFPLGRVYDEDGDFKYFLQVGECAVKKRGKVKVSKWIDTPGSSEYHAYICAWHGLLKKIEFAIGGQEDSPIARQINLRLLELFYMKGFDSIAEIMAGIGEFSGEFLPGKEAQ